MRDLLEELRRHEQVFLMSTLVGSGDTWSVLKFHVISFEQVLGSFHIMSHVVRMVDLSSHGVSSFFMMNTWMISMIVLDIINDIKSSMIAIRHFLSGWSFLSSSTHTLQNVRIVIIFIDSPWFDTKLEKWSMITFIIDVSILNSQLLVCCFTSKKKRFGQAMDQHTFVSLFLISIVSIRVVFFGVSSWILSIDYDWFSRHRTILHKHMMKKEHGSCLPSTCNLEVKISDCNHQTCFSIVFCLRDVNSVQWLICPSGEKKDTYKCICY